MLAVNFLQETGTGAGSIWIPVVILGWFLAMTLVGWQVSRHDRTVAVPPQDIHASDSDLPPSEFDNN